MKKVLVWLILLTVERERFPQGNLPLLSDNFILTNHLGQVGYYYFNVTGDDQTRFFLGTDANPKSAKMVASVTGWTQPTQHNKYSTQTSERAYLTAGRLYFFDLHHKEGYQGDFFKLFWKWGNADWRSIDKRYLFAYGDCGAQARSSQRITFEIAATDATADLQWAVENKKIVPILKSKRRLV
ncbi:MAG: hypothetical protein AAF960_23570 [Bacteroidota bacterium]